MTGANSKGDARQVHLPKEFVNLNRPQIETEAVNACPVCRGTSFHEFAVGFDYELLTCSNDWHFVSCDDCQHVWLNPRPAQSTLGTIYPPEYYAYNYETTVHPVARKGKELLDSMKMRALLQVAGIRPLSYVDVGCGSGRFLRFMDRQGVQRQHNFGLELDEQVVERLRGEGFQAYCERVEDCERIPDGTIDLVTMFHVIEHVDDPGEVLRKVATWLSPKGVFAIETPNIEALDARLFKESYWGGYHIPRHWNLFTKDSLTRLCNDAGLEVLGVRYQTGHSFWMYSLHHKLRYGSPPRRGLARYFDPLRGLPFLVAFTAFDKVRATLGFHTSAMLLIARPRRDLN